VAKDSLQEARYFPSVGVVYGILFAMGGSGAEGAVQTAEAYDPSNNTWTTIEATPTTRNAPGVEEVNGLLHVVGGTLNGNPVGTVEAFNPYTMKWTPEVSMPTARGNLGTGVINGMLYAVGGVAGGGRVTNAVEAFDPESAPFVVAPPAVGGVEGSMTSFNVAAADPDGDPMNSLTAAPLPLGASFSTNGIHTSGTFSWVPTQGQAGAYSVTISATSACRAGPVSGSITCDTGTATVSIFIGGSGSVPPTVTAPTEVSVEEGDTLSVVVNVTDPDDEAIESLSADLSNLPAENGATFTPNQTNTQGLLTWHPESGDAGTYAVTFTAVDESNLSGTATTSINVTRAGIGSPVVTAPALVEGVEGSRVTFTVTATDPDGDHIESLDVAPLPEGASFEVGASNASGTFDWTPNFTQAGVYNLTVTAQSCHFDSVGTVCDTGTAPVTLEIADTGANRNPPVVTAPSDVQVEEGGTLTVTVTASDPDDGPIVSLSADRSGLPEGNSGTFTTNASQTQGELVWHPGDGEAGTYAVTFTAVDGDTMSTSVTTTISVIPVGATVVGEVKWTPAAPDTGTFTITFTATDADSEVTTATTDVTVTSGPSGRRTLATRAPSALMEPQRGPIISVSSSSTIPAGEKWTLTVSVTPDETPPQGMAGSLFGNVMEPTRGPIISLRADLSSLPATNPPTFTTSFDPQVFAPESAEGQPGTAIVFQVSAGDPDGEAIDSLYISQSALPAGSVSSFTTNSDNTQGTFSWVPQVQDARDLPYRVVFTAANVLVASDTTLITVRAGNRAPVADAGGPYTGLVNVPLAFDGTASSDPDGDAVQYSWSFGDGMGAAGGTPSHTYASAGNYVAVLSVTDVRPLGSLVGIDSASVHIDASLGGRAFTTGGDRVIRLRAAKPTACVQLEPVGAAFEITDIDLSSIVLRSPGTGSVSEIAAVPGKKETKDLDGNGVLEISVCFEKAALRQLFSGVNGRMLIQTVIAGRLQSGAPFLAPMALDVEGASGAITATLAPNPFNPAAVLSFELPQAGAVRLQIFDIAGRLVREPIRGEHFAAGYHDVPIDGRDGNGHRMASGVYFYRLETASGSTTGRIVLMQ
jgi:hypothetical protein